MKNEELIIKIKDGINFSLKFIDRRYKALQMLLGPDFEDFAILLDQKISRPSELTNITYAPSVAILVGISLSKFEEKLLSMEQNMVDFILSSCPKTACMHAMMLAFCSSRPDIFDNVR